MIFKRALITFLLLFWVYCLAAGAAEWIISSYQSKKFSDRCDIMCFNRKCPKECLDAEDNGYDGQEALACDGRGCY